MLIVYAHKHTHAHTCTQVVKAGENEWTTFDVVFLPRSAGPVRDTLYIHTSHGTFDFKVSPFVCVYVCVCVCVVCVCSEILLYANM